VRTGATRRRGRAARAPINRVVDGTAGRGTRAQSDGARADSMGSVSNGARRTHQFDGIGPWVHPGQSCRMDAAALGITQKPRLSAAPAPWG